MLEKRIQFDFSTTQEIIQKIASIDAFRGKWQAVERKDNRHLRELKRIATIESIGSSTRIEGATLTDAEVEQLIGQIKITTFQSREEEEVFGYYEALDFIFEQYTEIVLSENHIKQLHTILLRYSTKDQRHRGEYKTLSNQVVAHYPEGHQRTIFRTTAPHLTEKAMQETLAWINAQREAGTVHPLLLTGLLVYEFLSIHPFQDGNGRLSRLLTTLMLLQAGYGFVQYVSLEHIIEARKQEYYRSLMAGQQHRGTDREVIGAWMLFFLDCLLTLIESLEIKYDVLAAKGRYLNNRQKRIRDWIAQKQPVRLSDIADALADIPLGTLKKDVLYLYQEGVLDRIGAGRGTTYVLKDTTDQIES